MSPGSAHFLGFMSVSSCEGFMVYEYIGASEVGVASESANPSEDDMASESLRPSEKAWPLSLSGPMK